MLERAHTSAGMLGPALGGGDSSNVKVFSMADECIDTHVQTNSAASNSTYTQRDVLRACKSMRSEDPETRIDLE